MEKIKVIEDQFRHISIIEYETIIEDIVKCFYIIGISDNELKILCQQHILNHYDYIIIHKNVSEVYSIVTNELRKFLRNKMEKVVEEFFLAKEEMVIKKHSR
jgi:hypothetical protein